LHLCLSKQVETSGVFDLRLTSYSNPNHTTADGECCGDRLGNECEADCSTFFRVCLTHVSRKISSYESKRRLDFNTPCTFGMSVSDIVDRSGLENNLPELDFNFDFSWPGQFLLIVEAWHSTNSTSPPAEEAINGGRLIMRYDKQRHLEIGDDWQDDHMTSERGVLLKYSYRVSCAEGFAGANCTVHCSSPNDTEARFDCLPSGTIKCRKGWVGERCNIPVCLEGCHPTHGYCEKPGECHCRLGWTGDTCSTCVPMFGCLHGGCNQTFECNCEEGWDGFFCGQPMCKKGCHPTRGYCDYPGECRCRIGWQGELCNTCRTLPGCVHGYCNKPLECICEAGWRGIFCHLPVCREGCDIKYGYCTKPNECRCRIGWQGEKCDQCFPYPGCQNGHCVRPWECNCEPGWGGLLCDKKSNYCEIENPCQNGSTCISKSEEDGLYLCVCPGGFTGKHCENRT
ncbi:delta-like protein 1, partial [Limulus polyphemus]|uniref:Delta-like protein n=1 Tax=Limulus polyphemus TaxID=6850 RepID=A0ABM1TQT1_LIMPO